MKIVSVLLFAAALIGSWHLVNRRVAVPEQMHASIQSELKNIIADYVQKNRPNSKNLQFEKFWTEAAKPNRVKAYFTYSFEDTSEESGETLTEISGTAVLNRAGETPDEVTWSLDELNIENNKVEFQEPINITATTGKTQSDQQ